MYILSFQSRITVLNLIPLCTVTRRNNKKINSRNEFIRLLVFSPAFVGMTLFLGSCDTRDALEQANCEAVEGSLLSAQVDGTPFCAVFVSDGPIAPGFHQIAGYSDDVQMLHVLFPLSVGSFDLDDEEVIGIGGSYLPDIDGETSFLSIGEGGWITITELTDDLVKGSFEFIAFGYHQETAEELGTQVVVTGGVFDVTLMNR